MVAIRKASSYSKRPARPNTRVSKKKGKAYIKTVPPSKVVKFNIGKKEKYDRKEFDTILRIISEERVQIRDIALESARQYITKQLETGIPGNFYFEIRTYPHHLQRENKMLTAPGADRMQTGMQRSYGKIIGRAAIVEAGKEIFLIATSGQKGIKLARESLNSIKAKLPCRTRITTEQVKKN